MSISKWYQLKEDNARRVTYSIVSIMSKNDFFTARPLLGQSEVENNLFNILTGDT